MTGLTRATHLVVAALLMCGNNTSAAAPAELHKLHALLVIDTLSGLGESVFVDGQRIENMLRGGVPRDRLDLVVLTGKDVTSDRILQHFQSLKMGPEDGLLFYYAGHGATDPSKGHFFALQQLDTAPLLRSEVRRVMSSRQPLLSVILSDCCSTRFKLPGKKRKVIVEPGIAKSLDPTLRCLLFQHRGVVDVTAAAEGAAFGDDDEGGLFTRTLARSIRSHSEHLSRNPDQFVTWASLFREVQSGTEKEFSHWSHDQQARGESIDQKTQKPRAFELPRDPNQPFITLRNGADSVVRYRSRWETSTEWEQVVMSPHGGHLHLAPGRATDQVLRVEFEDGEASTLHVGKVYTYRHASQRKSRGFEDESTSP